MADKTQAVCGRSEITVKERLKRTTDIDTSSVPSAEQFELFRSWHSDIARC